MKTFLVSLSNDKKHYSHIIRAENQTSAEDIMLYLFKELITGYININSKDITEEYSSVISEVNKLGFTDVQNLIYTTNDFSSLSESETTYIVCHGYFDSNNKRYEFRYSTDKEITATEI